MLANGKTRKCIDTAFIWLFLGCILPDNKSLKEENCDMPGFILTRNRPNFLRDAYRMPVHHELWMENTWRRNGIYAAWWRCKALLFYVTTFRECHWSNSGQESAFNRSLKFFDKDSLIGQLPMAGFYTGLDKNWRKRSGFSQRNLPDGKMIKVASRLRISTSILF